MTNARSRPTLNVSHARQFERSLADFCYSILEKERICDVWAESVKMFAEMGIEYVTYVHTGRDSFANTNLPEWWSDYYLAERKFKDDPFAHLCRTLETKLTGPEFLDRHTYLSEAEVQFVREASETGMISGFASPVGLVGMPWWGGWNLGTSLPAVKFEALREEIEFRAVAFGLFASQRIEALRLAQGPFNSEPILTRRERECLRRLARGKRTAEIAAALEISEVTVDFHVRNARSKLGAATREEVVAKAITGGHIP